MMMPIVGDTIMDIKVNVGQYSERYQLHVFKFIFNDRQPIIDKIEYVLSPNKTAIPVGNYEYHDYVLNRMLHDAEFRV
jgi:hypothetical protein